MYAVLVVFSALAVFAEITGVAARIVLSVLAVLPVLSLVKATVEDVCKLERLCMTGFWFVALIRCCSSTTTCSWYLGLCSGNLGRN
jgi:hypothetical protein